MANWATFFPSTSLWLNLVFLFWYKYYSIRFIWRILRKLTIWFDNLFKSRSFICFLRLMRSLNFTSKFWLDFIYSSIFIFNNKFIVLFKIVIKITLFVAFKFLFFFTNPIFIIKFLFLRNKNRILIFNFLLFNILLWRPSSFFYKTFLFLNIIIIN